MKRTAAVLFFCSIFLATAFATCTDNIFYDKSEVILNSTTPTWGLATGDLDNDGLNETVVVLSPSGNMSNQTGTGLVIMYDNNGAARIANITVSDENSTIKAFTTNLSDRYGGFGDVDQNGLLDVAFGQPVAIGDANNDGLNELLVAFSANSSAGTYELKMYSALNSLPNSTSDWQEYVFSDSYSNSPQSIVGIGDVDNDGQNEVVLGHGVLQVFKNVSGGWSSYNITDGIFTDFVIGDANNDGKNEIVAVNYSSHVGQVVLFENISGGWVQTWMKNYTSGNFGGSATPYGVAVGDIDGDGLNEIATANIDIIDGTLRPAGFYKNASDCSRSMYFQGWYYDPDFTYGINNMYCVAGFWTEGILFNNDALDYPFGIEIVDIISNDIVLGDTDHNNVSEVYYGSSSTRYERFSNTLHSTQKIFGGRTISTRWQEFSEFFPTNYNCVRTATTGLRLTNFDGGNMDLITNVIITRWEPWVGTVTYIMNYTIVYYNISYNSSCSFYDTLIAVNLSDSIPVNTTVPIQLDVNDSYNGHWYDQIIPSSNAANVTLNYTKPSGTKGSVAFWDSGNPVWMWTANLTFDEPGLWDLNFSFAEYPWTYAVANSSLNKQVMVLGGPSPTPPSGGQVYAGNYSGILSFPNESEITPAQAPASNQGFNLNLNIRDILKWFTPTNTIALLTFIIIIIILFILNKYR